MFTGWKRSVILVAAALAVGLLGVGLTTAAKPKPPAPSVSYTMTVLPTLGGAENWARGMNNAGDVVGTSQLPPQPDGTYGYHAFLYTGGQMYDLNSVVPAEVLPTGTVLLGASDINNLGQIVGYFKAPGGTWSPPFRYTPAIGGQPAEFLDLGRLGMRVAYAINDSGDVAGISLDQNGREYPSIYMDDLRGVFPLPATPDGTRWRPTAISNMGYISGYTTYTSTGDYAVQEAVRYTPGDTYAQPLGFLARSNTVGKNSSAYDVNDSGTVAGCSTKKQSVSHAFVYTDAGLRDLGTLGGQNSQAAGINSLGVVVGNSDDGISDFSPVFLYDLRDGTMKKVNITNDPGSYVGARWINDSGVICGVLGPGIPSRAFVLTPAQ
jgi:probable HAF family extracellular repeat protein